VQSRGDCWEKYATAKSESVTSFDLALHVKIHVRDVLQDFGDDLAGNLTRYPAGNDGLLGGTYERLLL
jgi:hypothetical protein